MPMVNPKYPNDIFYSNFKQALVYAIYCLCTHPEYITALREEITQGAIKGVSHENLPLLDAFLRESARMNPLDACKSPPHSAIL